MIREGRVDLVAVDRELLKNPDWAMKAIRIPEKS
jgi:2,4-dienoyl-CoA reductase-like NADH-dependent reductase (Old Yellow Enzyme family)